MYIILDIMFFILYYMSRETERRKIMTTTFLIGVIAGLITVAVIYKLAAKFTGASAFCKDNFDERQLLVRGNAYRYAFYTILILMAAWMILGEFISTLPITTGLALFIIMLISIDVYAVYSIKNDAYFGVKYDKRRYFIFFLVIIAMNLIGGIANIMGNEITAPFGLMECANIAVAAAFLPLLVLMGISAFNDREESDDEES